MILSPTYESDVRPSCTLSIVHEEPLIFYVLFFGNSLGQLWTETSQFKKLLHSYSQMYKMAAHSP